MTAPDQSLRTAYQESIKPASPKAKKAASFKVEDDQKKAFVNFFGSKIDVKVAGNGKGKIKIPFHSEEDFNRIIKLIKG